MDEKMGIETFTYEILVKMMEKAWADGYSRGCLDGEDGSFYENDDEALARESVEVLLEEAGLTDE